MTSRWLLVLAPIFAIAALAGQVNGRVVDGRGGVAGVRVYPDRQPHVGSVAFVPWALTNAQGEFTLAIETTDQILAVEKSGWQRDLVPITELDQPIRLHPAPQHRIEKALVVRLDFPDEKGRLSDDALRRLLFGRQLGLASAANYLYEVSKGSLELEEGAMLHLQDPSHLLPRSDTQQDEITRWVLTQLNGVDLKDFDRINNRTGALKPDGKPDHLWIIPPGFARNVTKDPTQFSAYCYLQPLPWKPTSRWGVVFFAEQTPLGNIVHELFHAMGEHRVDDFYLDCDDPLTAGTWDLMDTGQYRGWDRVPPKDGPWQEEVGYSPSHPGGWVRADLWYHGRFKATVSTNLIRGRKWTGWLSPLARATSMAPQRLVIPDSREKGRFWNLEVRRPWGFDRGRVGNRWGVGFEGLVVSRIDPHLLSRDDPKGPVRVIDAHPGTLEPPPPRYPCGRWELDDAAFNLGKGENPAGSDGPLSWEVLAVDGAGRMRVRIKLR